MREKPPQFKLPREVQRQIDNGEIPDPIWYVGRLGPSVQDVLDASDEELARMREEYGVDKTPPPQEDSRRPDPRTRNHRQSG